MLDYKLYSRVKDKSTGTVSGISMIDYEECWIEVDGLHIYTDPDNQVEIVEEVIDRRKIIYTTIGIYPNGDYVVNGVDEDDLEEHIKYNKTMRFGRGLMVNGVMVYYGNLDQSKHIDYINKYRDIIATQRSVSYQ